MSTLLLQFAFRIVILKKSNYELEHIGNLRYLDYVVNEISGKVQHEEGINIFEQVSWRDYNLFSRDQAASLQNLFKRNTSSFCF